MSDTCVQCAGILFKVPETSRVLLLRRSESSTHPGQWNTPGGHLKDGEPPFAGAVRECLEEMGCIPREFCIDYCIISNREELSYVLYVVTTPTEFEPALNWEHDDWRWVTDEEMPSMDLLPALLKTLQSEE